MSEYVLYHNPRCSKSRQALEILRTAGIEPRIIEYLKTPPSVAELRRLNLPARDLVRDNEDEFAQLKLADASEADLLAAIARYPILLQRPIVVHGDRAIVARPPELAREFARRLTSSRRSG